MGSLGPFELILIFLVVLLVFGARRIPEIARGLGKGIREFKTATTEIKQELTVDTNAPRINRPNQQTAPRMDAQQPEAQPASSQSSANETGD